MVNEKLPMLSVVLPKPEACKRTDAKFMGSLV
jgi:hypothetical protein